ncbi:hypothetical protein KCX82_03920 [Clostridiales bacterium BAD-6]|uniref:ABC transporter permease n=2 Tax=Sinanaerobacter chloroacetimidivorans TaxID=2818044 RepID=A0A8J8B0V3_9FIRM|nr:hypothetical protein [Sinanaerobacter chloroacetimidivorans]MBR0597011.1 hypothetical protein [Sinanaerobacter chloroacetimidivorans]
MEYVTYMILLFSVYSFLGWLLESIFATACEKKFINRGFLTGCFCPIYGFSAVLIVQSYEWVNNAFHGYFQSQFVIILMAIFSVTALEFVTGFLLEKFFHCKWWDYSSNALNIKGYICIKYSLLWGLLGSLLVQIVHPEVSAVLSEIPVSVQRDLSILLVIYFLADIMKSVAGALDLRKVLLNYSQIPVDKYYEKIIQYERLFFAFPRLLILNAGIINRDIRSILSEQIDKIKMEFKSRFL